MVHFKKLAKSILFLEVSMKEKKNKTAYCFDLDGTVTQEEILPEIANVLGIKEEIYALTKATMLWLLISLPSPPLSVKL